MFGGYRQRDNQSRFIERRSRSFCLTLRLVKFGRALFYCPYHSSLEEKPYNKRARMQESSLFGQYQKSEKPGGTDSP
jgi:hypothetical protein